MTIGRPPLRAVPGRHAFGPSYEDFVSGFYRAVLGLGVPTRVGLQDAGYLAEDIEMGVAELGARGFIHETADPDRWEVVPPWTAMGAYAEQVEQRLNLARATTGALDDVWRRSLGQQQSRELPPGVDPLASAQDVADRLRTLLRTSSRRAWWAIDGSRASRLVLEQAQQEDTGLLDARPGVDVRLMMDTSLLQDDAALFVMQGAVRAGHQVRVGNGIPFSLAVGDQTAIVDLTAFDPHGQGSLQTRVAPSVAALARLLEETYLLCTSYGEAADALTSQAGPPLDERDRRILELLTVGSSDKVVARQMGVSVRTVERRVRLIMDQLGTATRFQTGVQAVRRGWV